MQPVQKPGLVSHLVVPSLYVVALITIAAILFIPDIPLYNAFQATNVQVAPLGNSAAGQVGFSSIYLGITIVATFALVAVLARKRLTDKRWVILAGVFATTTFLNSILVFWYFTSWFELIALDGVIFTLFGLAMEGKIPEAGMIPFSLFFPVSTGIIFVMILPPITLISLPILYSLWDIYAVFKGPMVKLATSIPPKMKHLFLLKIGERSLGFGDLMFYSLMVCMGFTFGPLAGALSGGGVYLGVLCVLELLRSGKHRALPGLPIPIVLGFVGIGLGLLL